MSDLPSTVPGQKGSSPDENSRPIPLQRRRLRLHSEAMYLVSIFLIAVSVSMTVTADFGVSMVVAPAYLVSLKISSLTFGQSEYILQGILFVAFCMVVRRVKWVYFSSFLTCIIYGLVLDGIRKIPFFDAAMTPPESIPIPVRILLLIAGMTLTSFSIALFFQVYFYPQVYDFFVKGVADRYRLNRAHFKTGFDLSCLAVSVVLSWVLFGELVGIGIGTLIMALFNGLLIGWFSRLLNRTVQIVPIFPRLAEKFEI